MEILLDILWYRIYQSTYVGMFLSNTIALISNNAVARHSVKTTQNYPVKHGLHLEK